MRFNRAIYRYIIKSFQHNIYVWPICKYAHTHFDICTRIWVMIWKEMRKLKICNDSCCLFYIPYQNTIDLELIWSLSWLKLYQTNSLVSTQYLFPLFIALWFSLYVCIIETHSVCWYYCFHRSANIKYLASKTFMCYCNGKNGRSKNSICVAWLSFIQYV